MKGGKHTPGPYHTLKSTFDIADQVLVDEYLIIPPEGEVGPVGLASGEANAHLLAAAPDLLAACEALCAWYDDETPNVETLKLALRTARVAIAKAQGSDHETR